MRVSENLRKSDFYLTAPRGPIACSFLHFCSA